MSLSEKEKFILNYHGCTDIGLVRTENQDSYGKFPSEDLNLYNDKGQLFIVADGMGGHTGGKEASSTAVEVISKVFSEKKLDPPAFLKEAIESANAEINFKAENSEINRKMGTTCSTLLLKENKGTIGHVGDSRIYKIENSKITQLTMDHTKVNELLKEGILTKEEAKNYPSKSVLSRALGVEKNVKIDVFEFELKNGQTFILCSDGLGKVEKEEILEIVNQNNIKDACEKLMGLANERGGKDNVTVQIVKVDSDKVEKIPEPKKEKPVKEKFIKKEPEIEKPVKEKNNKLLTVIAVAVILIILIALTYQFKDQIFGTSKIEGNSILNKKSKVVPNNKKTNKSTNQEDVILMQAKRLYKQGKFESALVLYNEILNDEPMHLGAMQGINEIASVYFNQAEKLREGNHYDEAKKLYQKVKQIQPDNDKASDMIKICENEISEKNNHVDSLTTSIDDKDNSSLNNKVNEQNFNNIDWNFADLKSDQYKIDVSGIEFINSDVIKKAFYKTSLTDAVLSVNTELYYFNGNSTVGLIIGYNKDQNSSEDSYYLFSFTNDGDFALKKVTGSTSQQLLFIHSEKNKNNDKRFVKIECKNNIIRIYNGNGLLSTWINPDKITGKVGLYADMDVSVKFTDLSINGIKSN